MYKKKQALRSKKRTLPLANSVLSSTPVITKRSKRQRADSAFDRGVSLLFEGMVLI